MNVNSVQNVQVNPEVQTVNVQQNAMQNTDFMNVISQVMSQSNQSQKSDALKLLTGQQYNEEDVNEQLMKLLTQYNSANSMVNGINLFQLMSQVGASENLQSTVLEGVGGTDNGELLSLLSGDNQNPSYQLLGQLLGENQTDNTDIISQLTSTDDNDVSKLIMQLLNGDSENSNNNDIISQLMNSQMSSVSTDSTKVLNQLSGTDNTSTLAGMLNAFSTDNSGDGAISTNSALPINALYELAKIYDKQQSPENVEDFSQLSTGEKIQALKTAIANGDVTIEKDTDISDVVNQLSSNYKLADSVNKAKQAIANGDDEKTDVTQLADKAVEKVYDFTRLEPEVRVDTVSNENADIQRIVTQTADGISKAVSDGVERFSVKLNPQGLGEIIVKMEKSADGIVVNLVASTSKTADILNSQLSNLQASLSHFNTQINPAEFVAPTQNTNAYSFSQQMAGQSFAQGQNNAANQSQQQGSYYSSGYSSDNDEVAQAAQRLAESGALNITV